MIAGEIHLARFPFAGTVGVKIRPVLLLTGPIGPVPELLTAYISSAIPASLISTDLVLNPSSPAFASTRLKTVSVLRLHKLWTMHRIDVVRFLGTLSQAAMADVEVRLRSLLNL